MQTVEEEKYLRGFARILWGIMIATIGIAAVMLICFSSHAHARKAKYYPTPSGTTCADVKQKQREYGFTSVAQAKAFAGAQGIIVTPTQERQILSCLKR